MLALVAMVVAWTRSVAVAGIVGAFMVLLFVASSRPGRQGQRSGTLVVILIAVGLLMLAIRAESQWQRASPNTVGSYVGWARVVDDPQPYPGSTRVIFEIEGQRYEYWCRGRASRLRTERWNAGEHLRISATLKPLDSVRRDRVAWQHIVGVAEVDWVGDEYPSVGIAGASNRLRGLIERGASSLPFDDGALFRGLVIGDDRDEPPEMIQRFRRSGLSHLTAVSGQNVVFVLAAASPILRRLRPWSRWLVTLGLVAWFVSLTRFEPSIIRAGVMAAISATGFFLGRERRPVRVLGVAVVSLVVIDPMISRSVGFVLSVGATYGVVAIGPVLTRWLSGWGWLAEPVGVTLGAQLGVVLPSLLVFGRLPLVSVPANLVAVPVAGFVMFYGLPAGLVAGAVPEVAPVVMFPCRVGVRWVDTVAVVAAAAEPSGSMVAIGWIVLVFVCAAVGCGIRWRGGQAVGDEGSDRGDRRDELRPGRGGMRRP